VESEAQVNTQALCVHKRHPPLPASHEESSFLPRVQQGCGFDSASASPHSELSDSGTTDHI
jgi:hypothetical protein